MSFVATMGVSLPRWAAEARFRLLGNGGGAAVEVKAPLSGPNAL